MCVLVTIPFEPHKSLDGESATDLTGVPGIKHVNSLDKCLGELKSAQKILEHSLILSLKHLLILTQLNILL